MMFKKLTLAFSALIFSGSPAHAQDGDSAEEGMSDDSEAMTDSTAEAPAAEAKEHKEKGNMNAHRPMKKKAMMHKKKKMVKKAHRQAKKADKKAEMKAEKVAQPAVDVAAEKTEEKAAE